MEILEMTLALLQQLIDLGKRDGAGFHMEPDNSGLGDMRLSIGDWAWITRAPLTDEQLIDALISASVHIELKKRTKYE
jgi:hypothetical protein